MAWLASKILWPLAQPSNLGLVILLIAVVGCRYRWRSASTLLTMTMAGLCLIVILPIGQWLLLPLERRIAPLTEMPADIDGVIVLGGAFNTSTSEPGRPELGDAAERVTAMVALGLRYPKAKLVYSGGVGNLTGARVQPRVLAKDFFEQLGVAKARITFEGRSRNTWENGSFSKMLVNPSPDEHWLLVTSASHMPRAIGVFQRLQWYVIPFPVDYQVSDLTDKRTYLDTITQPNVAARLGELDKAIKEWVGLLAYWLMDRTTQVLPTRLPPKSSEPLEDPDEASRELVSKSSKSFRFAVGTLHR